ncbi:glucose-6-phosphate isomerase [Bogoriella caseilytica]|uniref:Glucose-6-phosphate isomerase n=1 Tax=Bogoriella caseilytica TaxID=56055 RepID=A0A3N2BGG9_9MICO|nr:glucose-6-phosphate isomerase [Bogoriella caseilytica]ROR74337.1 glucose-6-phosphate isomerase [Bogoriella caseilytica]
MTANAATIAWAGPEEGAVVEVSATGAAASAVSEHLPGLLEAQVASRLSAQDPTLWGPDAEEESAKRLGWTALHETSRALIEPLTALYRELQDEGIDRVVLCGMGGSSLAPEVIVGTAARQLVVLDSTHPDQVQRALDGDLARTVVVISSKSGSTVETDSQRRTFEAAFTAAGIEAASRIVVVTDPGSPLHQAATEAGYRAVFEADPNVGGRFSALTAFGLVPAALAGVDVGELLDEAAAVAPVFAEDSEANPALVLGAAIAGELREHQGVLVPVRDKLVFTDAASGLYHFADWAEQLIAESTGKIGTGLLPVVAESDAPELTGSPAADVLPVLLTSIVDEENVGAEAEAGGGEESITATEVTVAGSLGGLMLLWEHAISIASQILRINPFDQPDVESAKSAAREMLDSAGGSQEPAAFTGSGIEVRGGDFLQGTDTVDGAVAALLGELDAVPEGRGYLAVQAYLDREGAAAELLAPVRAALAQRTGRPVTFGWGPRFLHSTGQYHKGGSPTGVFLQLTADPEHLVDVPGRAFDYATLIAAQAAGDAAVLAGQGRPVLRLHITSPDALAWLAGVLAAPGAVN